MQGIHIKGMQNLTKGFQIIIFLKKGEEKTDDIWQKGFEFNSKMVKKEFFVVILIYYTSKCMYYYYI